ncbi:hypothetical protein FG152_18030 [Ochrobactrum sp. XJ1]|nr:hypothetical protein [Ochrobactrum sp. XJ1]
MPFFLVTHRSLVEADSEQDAAVKALEKIESGRKLEFEVKFDEATITRVVLDKVREEPRSLQTDDPTSDQRQQATTHTPVEIREADQQQGDSSSQPMTPERPSARTTTMVSVFLGGLVLATLLIGAL